MFGPWHIQESLSSGRVGGDFLRVEKIGSFQPCEIVANHHRILDIAVEPGGERGSLQGGRVRRQCGRRLALSEVLGSTPAEATCQPRSRPSPVVRHGAMGPDMAPSGPSIDRSRNMRSLLDVQKRGSWRSHKLPGRIKALGFRETARGCDVRTGPHSKTAYQSKGSMLQTCLRAKGV